MSNNKVKGLLKGLRYISQIFDNEKEQEIQIGYPTDVKHVAHIGWDGPSVNSPSWMNEYKASPGFASAPLNLTGDVHNKGPDNSVKWVSEDSSRRSSRYVNCQGQGQGQGRDLPELPKASRRQSTGSMTDSPTKEKSDKPRQSRKSSSKHSQSNKESSDGSKPTGELMPMDSIGSPARSLPDIPKRSRGKKSKDNSNGGGSSKSRSKAQSSLDPNSGLGSPSGSISKSPSGSISKSKNKQRSFEEDVQCERGFSGIS